MTEQSKLSLLAVAKAVVTTSKQHSTLVSYLFAHSADRKRKRSGPPPWTPLHAACYDRDGQRGEAKIVFLLGVARENGIALDALAKERRDIAPGIRERAPFEVLAKNPASTVHALELVFDAWPGGLVDMPPDLNLNPIQRFILTFPRHGQQGEQRFLSKMNTMLRLAGTGVSSLLMYKECQTTLHLAFYAIRVCTGNEALFMNVAEQLLRACPETGTVTDFYGNNFLHTCMALSVRSIAVSVRPFDSFLRRFVQLIVESASKRCLVAMLSTENERYNDSTGTQCYDETPICIIERQHLWRTRELLVDLSNQTDPNNGWTLLHHTATNQLGDGDPQEKQERERERVFRAEISAIPNRIVGSMPPPPVGPRQGTKKLVDWLLEVHPQACSQRDSSGRFPLHLAVETGKVWRNGIESLVQGYPMAVTVRDPTSELFPFMTAAIQPEADLNTIYSLLRFHPSLAN